MRLQTAHERLLNFLSHYIRRAKSVHLWPYRIFHLQVLEKHLAKFTPDTIFCATEDHYICSQFGCVAFYRTFECGPLNLRLYRQSGIAVVEVAFVYTLLVRCGKYLVVLYHVTVFFVFREREREKKSFVIFFLLDDSSASEFYVPTFRNTLFHLHRRCKQEE